MVMRILAPAGAASGHASPTTDANSHGRQGLAAAWRQNGLQDGLQDGLQAGLQAGLRAGLAKDTIWKNMTLPECMPTPSIKSLWPQFGSIKEQQKAHECWPVCVCRRTEW
jgi:hypothetical protein